MTNAELKHYEIMGMEWSKRKAQENSELYHYGVIGMKWGKRKAQETAELKAKAKKVAENKTNSKSDRNLAKIYATPTSAKYAKIAMSLLTGQVVARVFARNNDDIKVPSKEEFLKQVTKQMVINTPSIVINNAAAKSALKNYDNNGNLINKERTNKKVTPEMLAAKSTSVAYFMAPRVVKMGKKKISQSKLYVPRGQEFVNSLINE